MSEIVYILGPMRGIKWYNFPAFDAMRDTLTEQGHQVESPADIDRDNGFDPFARPESFYDWNEIPAAVDLKEIIRRDMDAVQRCTAYVCLPGWEKSTGAKAEKALADWLGLKDLTILNQQLPTESKQPLSICQEAQSLTTGDRAASYGHPLDNFTVTANLINARFGTTFSPEDFAEIMILCKIARQVQAKKRDNLVDIAGYSNTHQMVIDERERRRKLHELRHT